MIRPLIFDTSLFGYRVGKWESSASDPDVNSLFDQAGNFDLVYVFGEARAIPEGHCQPISTRVVWEKQFSQVASLLKAESPCFKMGKIEGLSISKWEETVLNESDQSAIRDLVLTCGAFSRFNKDPFMVNNEYEKLYTQWWLNVVKQKKPIHLARINKEIAGLITLGFSQNSCHVDLFAVLPQFQRMGIGWKLLLKAMQTARESGMETLDLATQKDNVKAMGFYEKAGFRKLNETIIQHWRPKGLKNG
ncbi:MAG: GNAT family N-acetyltransferase [Cyclobacteriaceae bacterium]